MKKIIVICLIVIAFIVIGCASFAQYIKSNFANKINQLSNNVCQISYHDISIKSFSLPLKFNFVVNQPSVLCTFDNAASKEKYNFNTFSKEILFLFNVFDKYIKLNMPYDIKIDQGGEVVSCSGFNDVSAVFTNNVFSIMKDTNLANNLRQLSYKNNDIKCVDSSNNTFMQDMFLDVLIDYSGKQLNKVSVLMNDVRSASNNKSMSSNINVLFTISQDKKYAIDVKNFTIRTNDYTVNIAGELGMESIPYVSGRLVIDINNYSKLIKGIGNTGYSSESALDMLSKYANYMDEDRVSIIIQNIGEELYIGKQPVKELLQGVMPAYNNNALQ